MDEIQLDENIARNQALKENVFMMVVCIELRIPLFLVGKPGSSKSLAKTIVADAMQRENASSPLFRTFKQVNDSARMRFSDNFGIDVAGNYYHLYCTFYPVCYVESMDWYNIRYISVSLID